jgi:exopolysaccharide biosynthesis predicted pyruvyltransferase EpsI
LRALHREARRLILLPHTITDVDVLLAEFGPNVTLICREKVTFNYARAHAPRSEVQLMHDLAFELDLDALMSRKTAGVPYWLPGHFAFNKLTSLRPHCGFAGLAKALRNRSLPEGRTSATGNFFRTDGESCGWALPADNTDISEHFSFGLAPRGLVDLSAQRFVAAIDTFNVVRTDRLHVAITAGLLGKDVEFYPNNYFKCAAVFEHSIEGKFPNIRWMQDRPPS